MSSEHIDVTIAADALERFAQAIRRDGRYPREAYEFLQRGLAYTAALGRDNRPADTPRHVTGQQLCQGLRTLALEQWGLLAQTVLAHWNVHRTRDFGEMVFLMVQQRLMGKQDSDRIEDFDDVFDFGTAFGSYAIPLASDREDP